MTDQSPHDDFDLGEDALAAEPNGTGAVNGKPSLREIWDNSPGLKIVAVALGLVVLVGGYFAFAGDKGENKAVVRLDDTSGAKQVPGQSELDPAYRQALEDNNKKEAERAAETGGSALPTPINTPKSSGLDVNMPEKPPADPLAEWRKLTESRRANVAPADSNETGATPVPDVVPMAQPIRPAQPLVQQNPEDAKALAEQMRVILAAQTPSDAVNKVVTAEPSPYALLRAQKKSQEEAVRAAATGASSAAGGAAAAEKANVRTIVPAGTIAYAQLLNQINSDIDGPALVQILSGPFAGARAIGKVSARKDYSETVTLNFTTLTKDAVNYKMNGIALDEKTTLAGQATDVDHHYFQRIVLPAAAKFLEGYSGDLAEKESSTTVSGLVTITTQPKAKPKDSLYKGLEEAGSQAAEVLEKEGERPITIHLAKGTTMGILFIDAVTTEDATR